MAGSGTKITFLSSLNGWKSLPKIKKKWFKQTRREKEDKKEVFVGIDRELSPTWGSNKPR